MRECRASVVSVAGCLTCCRPRPTSCFVVVRQVWPKMASVPHLAHLARFDLPHLEPGLPAEGQLPLAEPPRRQLREVLDAPLVCRRLPRLLRLDLGGVLSRERTELELPPLRLVSVEGQGQG